MKKLIFTRGLPGSGKSTMLRHLELDTATISADAVRYLMGSPTMNAQGAIATNHGNESKVWGFIRATLEARLRKGDTTVLDACNTTSDDINSIVRLAAGHGYEVACLDFSGIPIDVCMQRNMARKEMFRVGLHVMNRMHTQLQSSALPESVHRIPIGSITAPEMENLKLEVDNWLYPVCVDGNEYAQVLFVGDLQGCYSPLMEVIQGGFRDDTLYVFTGDYLDRGPENGQVARFIIDEALSRENVHLLRGNHEDHIDIEIAGKKPVSEEVGRYTLPQLKSSNVTTDELKRWSAALQDVIVVKFNGVNVLACHGGLSTVPEKFWMLSSEQYIRGTGRYQDNVDLSFAGKAPPFWRQVHGHRNTHHHENSPINHSFNLEEAVEDGGNLRAVRLSASGFSPIEVRNKVFRPFRERVWGHYDFVPTWVREGSVDDLKLPDALVRDLNNHKMVAQRHSNKFPHVVSHAFTKNAFYGQAWDSITCKARGLFEDIETHEVVARSYDKFFNYGENLTVAPERLKEELKFPLTAWVKENGFLGIAGYDARTDALFLTSKSQPDSPFATYLEELIHRQLPRISQRDELRRFLRNSEASMIFEVNDPVNDPHMIAYEEPHLVLLDVVRRSHKFEKLPYEELQKVGAMFGLKVKQKALVLNSWEGFVGWQKAVQKNMNLKIEGYVLEDSSGFMFKQKAPYYSFWKIMRSLKEAEYRQRTNQRGNVGVQLAKLSSDVFDLPPECVTTGHEFYEWVRELDTQDLLTDIITLRERFFERDWVVEPARLTP
ncbi:RNA ligase [Thalassospira xianhensis]|uniref:Serine/threonine specific protein phosphatases domain-containing protein n=1 Tax=Thalassospira xianhensis MCCC 1A02616 TaxID=1177929 RepID=A0A367UIN2_9PROT|nr:RNA ligase [Thalassospira xianhensis]RCK07881.1 hypothetical protein TH5_02440 [Thalassospira xianhensis MCCC 1A02616]